MLSKKQLFTKGMIDISPHMLSVIPFGIICGAIGVELGFNPYLVYAMSFIIFGGASQIVFLQLLEQDRVLGKNSSSSFVAGCRCLTKPAFRFRNVLFTTPTR